LSHYKSLLVVSDCLVSSRAAGSSFEFGAN